MSVGGRNRTRPSATDKHIVDDEVANVGEEFSVIAGAGAVAGCITVDTVVVGTIDAEDSTEGLTKCTEEGEREGEATMMNPIPGFPPLTTTAATTTTTTTATGNRSRERKTTSSISSSTRASGSSGGTSRPRAGNVGNGGHTSSSSTTANNRRAKAVYSTFSTDHLSILSSTTSSVRTGCSIATMMDGSSSIDGTYSENGTVSPTTTRTRAHTNINTDDAYFVAHHHHHGATGAGAYASDDENVILKLNIRHHEDDHHHGHSSFEDTSQIPHRDDHRRDGGVIDTHSSSSDRAVCVTESEGMRGVGGLMTTTITSTNASMSSGVPDAYNKLAASTFLSEPYSIDRHPYDMVCGEGGRDIGAPSSLMTSSSASSHMTPHMSSMTSMPIPLHHPSVDAAFSTSSSMSGPCHSHSSPLVASSSSSSSHHHNNNNNTTPPLNVELRKVRLLMEFEEKSKINEWPANTSVHCYWCCHRFDSVPFGVPIKFSNGKFHVVGCFCGLSCAAAYNFAHGASYDEIWERYSLINMLAVQTGSGTSGVVKPAPDRLSLTMFGGHLSIDEFRRFPSTHKTTVLNFPPMMTMTQQIEEINDCDIRMTYRYIPLDHERVNRYQEKIKLKRSKPLINFKNTLDHSMNLKYAIP